MKYADTIFNRTTLNLCFRDRIKALLNGKVIVELEIKCEHAPGALESSSRAYAPVLMPRKSGGGYAEVGR